jgi:hypothetical protein
MSIDRNMITDLTSFLDEAKVIRLGMESEKAIQLHQKWALRKEPTESEEIAAVIFDRPTPNVTYNWEGDISVAIHHKPGPTGLDISELYAVLCLLDTEVSDVIGIVSSVVK